jgi:hypothetical protein
LSAISSAQAGNWSATATWTGGVVPSEGNTVTISHDVTVDVDTTVGSDPGTGGTAAVAFSSSVADKTLTIAAGKTLTLKGDLTQNANGTAAVSTVALAAGASLVFLPKSGATYVWNMSNNAYVTAAGTAGSRCTIKTDKTSGGSAARMVDVDEALRTKGLKTVAYCDFIDFGSTTVYGLFSKIQYPDGVDVSITHCTFTRCNFSLTDEGSTYWDGHAVFDDNVFTSSVKVTTNGIVHPLRWSLRATGAAKTRSVQRNGLDGSFYSGSFKGVTFADNVVAGIMGLEGTVVWGTFARNLILANTGNGGSGTDAIQSIQASGNVTDSYIASSCATNPGYINDAASGSITIDGCIFENTSASNDGAGDVFDSAIDKTTTATITWSNNLVLPSANAKPAGICSILGTASPDTDCSVVLNHNTHHCGQQPAFSWGESHDLRAGQVTSFKSNLCWSTTQEANSYKIMDFGDLASGGVENVVSPTNADYNGSWNLHAENPSVYPGNTYTHAGRGYQANFSATPGTHDVDGINPGFVDSTRNLGTWWLSKGNTTTGTYAGDAAAAVAYAAANPATRVADLLAWVKAGFAPTNAAYRGTAHDSGDIGAVAWESGAPVEGAASSYTWDGPATARNGVASAEFEVVLNGNYTGTITPDDSSDGGTFTPSSLTWSGTGEKKTFTYTAASTGAKTLGITANPALGTNPADRTLTVTEATTTQRPNSARHPFQPPAQPPAPASAMSRLFGPRMRKGR